MSPTVGRYDTPLTIEISGLAPNHRLTLEPTTHSATGHTYTSTATYTSDARGVLDFATTAPISGSYSGPRLLWSMGCVDCDVFLVPHPPGYTVTLTVIVDGAGAATGQFSRRLDDPGVSENEERPASVSFFGDYFKPATPGPPRPAILLFGGSEGGLDLNAEASLLASNGYPALDLAYFGEPGLPQNLMNIAASTSGRGPSIYSAVA